MQGRQDEESALLHTKEQQYQTVGELHLHGGLDQGSADHQPRQSTIRPGAALLPTYPTLRRFVPPDLRRLALGLRRWQRGVSIEDRCHDEDQFAARDTHQHLAGAIGQRQALDPGGLAQFQVALDQDATASTELLRNAGDPCGTNDLQREPRGRHDRVPGDEQRTRRAQRADAVDDPIVAPPALQVAAEMADHEDPTQI